MKELNAKNELFFFFCSKLNQPRKFTKQRSYDWYCMRYTRKKKILIKSGEEKNYGECHDT